MSDNVKVANKSIKKSLGKTLLILFLVVIIFIIQFIVLGILYLTNKTDALKAAIIISSVSLLVIIVLLLGYILFKYYKVFYGQFYKNTVSNYNTILKEEKRLTPYENKSNIEEINDLNKIIDSLNIFYSRIIYKNGKIDYNSLNLEFVDNKKNVITYESFEQNYRKLIELSCNFRNAFVSFQYPKNVKRLTKDECDLFDMTVNNIFHYENILLVNNYKNNEYLLYIPRFDSLKTLKEDLEKGVKEFCVNRNVATGYELTAPRVSAVIYPYSSFDDILGDLRYAKTLGKALNFYVPNKFKNESNDMVLEESRNTNIISRCLESLSAYNSEDFSLQDLKNKVNTLFNSICNYFSFDMAGIVTYDQIENKYINKYIYGSANIASAEIEKDFIDLVDNHVDGDGTFYFSSRKNVDADFGRYIDKFGIECGHYYCIKNDNTIKGIIYFTKNNPTVLDSYVRESLLVFSIYLSNYLFRIENLTSEEHKTTQLNDLLKITGCGLYTINKNDYTLLSFSPSLGQLIPSLTVGCKCYEGIYGKTKRCDKCPYKNGKKYVSIIKNAKYESSLTLSKLDTSEVSILLSPVASKDYTIRERFDHDLLINSYYSFFEGLKDSFMVTERGYVLVMNIDNIEDLINKLSSELLNSYLRNFFNNVKQICNDANIVYTLSNHSFAIVKANANNNDIIELAEKLYVLSKTKFGKEKDNISLNISYFVVPYPFGYQNPNDYAKFLRVNTVSKSNLINKDYIYVTESKYLRSASHTRYLMNVLDTSITTNTFKVKLQPVISRIDKSILSAELLFRIADANRGGELNTGEVISAAANENKIHIITTLLMQYIEYLYENYDKTLFKKYNFNKLSINIDYSFFEDKNFINQTKVIKDKYKLNDDYLTFEIPESELNAHLVNIPEVVNNVKENNITLICDNYTGEFITLEKLHSLGFNGVKLSRKLVGNIDTDQTALDGLTSMLDVATNLGFDITIVGIENAKQFNLLRTLNYKFNLQGFYFYRPLDIQDFINAMFKSNQ